MAGARKSARMSERRQLEEEDEERKREDDRKRQRTLFQRKDNIIRKNDIVVDTRLGKIALVPEEAPEDVKVKVEANDEELMEELDHFHLLDEERVEIPITAGRADEDRQDNRPETVVKNGIPISDSSHAEVEVKPEVPTFQSTTATNEQVEAKMDYLRLELEGMKQLVKEQDHQIIQLSTELETVKTKEQENVTQFMRALESVRSEMESEKQERKAELEVCKAENTKLEARVNQLTRAVEAAKRESEREINFSPEGSDPPETPNQLLGQNERESKENQNPPQDHTEDVAVLPLDSNAVVGHGTGAENRDIPHPSEGRKTRTPMIIDPRLAAVLSRILKFLGADVQSLKTFRLVSRAWNQVSLPVWRNTAVIRLLPDLAASCTTGGINISKFLMEHQNDQSSYKLADKPYSRYNLENLFIDERIYWDRFWDLIGPLMEYVHFQDCIIANTTSDAFAKLLIDKMPNLKELALTSVKYDTVKKADTAGSFLGRNHSQLRSLVVSGVLQICLNRLLVYLPCLESIKAIDDGERIVYDDMLDEISCAKEMNPASLPNLKHLDLMNTFMQLKMLKECDPKRLPQKMERLARANLQLKSLAMTFAPINDLGEASIGPFLTSQANTLQVLRLFQAPTHGNEFRAFLCQVEMTALKEIHLWGCITGRLDFLKYTPNLKILYVNLTCLEKRDRMKEAINILGFAEYKKFGEDMVEAVKDVMEGVVVGSLETLHIDYEFPEKSVRALAKWIPNLKVLKTIVSWNNISAVVEEWSELEELTCLFKSKLGNWNIYKEETRSRRKRGAVISDLKKLEHFQLDCLCDASNLTDASVFNGFLWMPSLKSVQICVSKQFTDNAEKALKDKIKNCRIIRNYSEGDHSNYGCCLRREFDLEVAATGLLVKSKDDEEESDYSDTSEEDLSMYVCK